MSTQCSPDVKVPSSTANRGRNTAASTPSGVGGGKERKEKGKTKKKKRKGLDDTCVMCCTADDEGRSTGRAGRLWLLAREARKGSERESSHQAGCV